MRQEIRVLVELTYDADARLSVRELDLEVRDDLGRLLDADSESRVEMTGFEVRSLWEEAEIYGNKED